MIIQCDKCSTKFRLDDSRVTGNGVRVRCTKCQNVFIVTPPPPVDEVQVEDVLTPPDRQAVEEARKPAPQKRITEDLNLKFDFGKPQAAPSEEPKGAPEAAAEKAAENKPKVPASFDDIDFSFSTDRSSGREFTEEPPVTAPAGGESDLVDTGKKDWDLGGQEEPAPAAPGASDDDNWDLSGGEKPAFETSNGWDLGGEEKERPAAGATVSPVSNGDWSVTGTGDDRREEPYDEPRAESEKTDEEKSPFSDMDFGSGAPKAASEAPAGPQETVKEAASTDSAPEEPRVSAVSAPEPARRENPFVAAYKGDVKGSSAPAESAGGESAGFSKYLSDEMTREEFDNGIIGEVEEGDEEEEGPAAEVPERSASSRALLVAAIVFLVGGAVIYFSGIIDKLTARLMPATQVAAQKTVEIETIAGRYIDNKNFGKFFVVQATIRNITDSPQPVKAVTGVLYDSKGGKLASRSVAPGRVVSAEDLENLQKDDLLKPFKDPSGGTLPPKGTVPVMIPFTEPPQGIAEYGIEIVR